MTDNLTLVPLKTGLVEAVGVASRSGTTTRSKIISKLVSDAMTAAVAACLEEGISTEEKNSAVIRERMMAARQYVLDQVAASDQELKLRLVPPASAITEDAP